MDNMLLARISGVESVARFVTVLLLFVFVCFITYYTTKFTASFQKGRFVTSNMEVIEAMRLSNSQSIQIVRIGEKYIAIAVCKDSVSVLCELQEDELMIKESKEVEKIPDFKTLLEKVKGKADTKNKKQADRDER